MANFEREVVLCRTLRRVQGGFIIETDGRSDIVCRTFDEVVKTLKRVLEVNELAIKKEEKESRRPWAGNIEPPLEKKRSSSSSAAIRRSA